MRTHCSQKILRYFGSSRNGGDGVFCVACGIKWYRERLDCGHSNLVWRSKPPAAPAEKDGGE